MPAAAESRPRGYSRRACNAVGRGQGVGLITIFIPHKIWRRVMQNSEAVFGISICSGDTGSRTQRVDREMRIGGSNLCDDAGSRKLLSVFDRRTSLTSGWVEGVSVMSVFHVCVS